MPTLSSHIVWLVGMRVEMWRCSLGWHYSKHLSIRAGHSAQQDND